MNQKFLGIVLLTASFCILISSAVRFNLAATASAEASSPVTIIVDAGHGGEDGGTQSASGVLESKINLDISLRLEQLLAFSGIKPLMLRSSDTALYSENCHSFSEKKVSDLKNRVSMVNAVTNGVLVSIHQNHFSESKYSGAQVFYNGSDGSRQLAELMQSSLRCTLNPNNDRMIKKASSIYLMEHTECTGILIECGFLSNQNEAYLLQQPSYQMKIAGAICAALSEYLEGERNLEV